MFCQAIAQTVPYKSRVRQNNEFSEYCCGRPLIIFKLLDDMFLLWLRNYCILFLLRYILSSRQTLNGADKKNRERNIRKQACLGPCLRPLTAASYIVLYHLQQAIMTRDAKRYPIHIDTIDINDLLFSIW